MYTHTHTHTYKLTRTHTHTHTELPLREDIGYKFVVWRAAREHSLGASTPRRLHIPTESILKSTTGSDLYITNVLGY